MISSLFNVPTQIQTPIVPIEYSHWSKWSWTIVGTDIDGRHALGNWNSHKVNDAKCN